MKILKTSKLSVIINPCHAEYLSIYVSHSSPIFILLTCNILDGDSVDPDQMASSEAS